MKAMRPPGPRDAMAVTLDEAGLAGIQKAIRTTNWTGNATSGTTPLGHHRSTRGSRPRDTTRSVCQASTATMLATSQTNPATTAVCDGPVAPSTSVCDADASATQIRATKATSTSSTRQPNSTNALRTRTPGRCWLPHAWQYRSSFFTAAPHCLQDRELMHPTVRRPNAARVGGTPTHHGATHPQD